MRFLFVTVVAVAAVAPNYGQAASDGTVASACADATAKMANGIHATDKKIAAGLASRSPKERQAALLAGILATVWTEKSIDDYSWYCAWGAKEKALVADMRGSLQTLKTRVEAAKAAAGIAPTQ